MTRRPCLICGRITTAGSYCRTHLPTRSWTWRRISETMLEQHRRRHGDWCPGAPDLNHDPHPCSDLTVDHKNGDPNDHRPENLRVLCRVENGRKGGGGSKTLRPPTDEPRSRPPTLGPVTSSERFPERR